MDIKSIDGKVKIILIAFVAILLVSASFMLYQSSVASEKEFKLMEKEYPGIILAHRLKFHTVQVQQWLTDISATRGQDGLNDGFDEAQNNADEFYRVAERLNELNPELNGILGEVTAAFPPYFETGRRMAQSYVDHGPAGGNKVMAEFDGVAATINEKVDSLLAELESGVEISWVELSATKDVTNWVIIFSGTVMMVIFGFFVFLVMTILKAMKEMGGEFTLLGHGDFETRVRTIDARHDELGELGRNISSMKHQLRDMVKDITGAASELNGCASSMSSVTSSTMVSVEQQQMETEQVASAVTEMSANAKEVAINASKAAESARGADVAANNGKNVVHDTVNSIESLADSVNSAADAIHKLEQDSESIGTILEVIRSIADQTNLLALNAAIEAARAGEQGRGFAVVADEVRTLASRTQDATGDIQSMIEQLQSGAAHAVSVMEAGKEKTRQSVDYVLNARDSLNEITDAVNIISDMSTQIAAAAEEQSTVAEEVSRNTNNISDVNIRNSGSVQEIVNSTMELSTLSQRLDNTVSSFKIE
ncbi:MAG: methyl-accepting chemotaxis protein [Gammaproteobacteria bacterium]|nr:methyl-accepting chemotaxis protein [Gammaproteobacteria bacterium]